MPLLVVEHLERLSYWVWLEYLHLSRAWGKQVLFTNVKDPDERRKLSRLGFVEERSVAELDFDDVIVLDPAAPSPLSPDDVHDRTAIVIGGICGEFRLTGKTGRLVTSGVPNARVRNLGSKQLTTDTAALAALLISSGKPLDQLSFTDSVEVEVTPGSSVELPYGYLLVDGRPLITPGLVQIFEAEYFEISDFPGASKLLVGAVTLVDDRILLIHRKVDPILWEFPSGQVEYGESLIQAMERELKEETTLEVKQFFGYAGDFRWGDSRQFNFIVEGEGDVELVEDHDAYRFVTFREYLELEKGLGKKLAKPLLKVVVSKLEKLETRWQVIASANLFLQGVWDGVPNDVDVLVDDLSSVRKLFGGEEFDYGDGSHRLRTVIAGFECEFMDSITVGGKTFRAGGEHLRPLEEELEMYELLGRRKDREKILAIKRALERP